jgi:hypothetical protein
VAPHDEDVPLARAHDDPVDDRFDLGEVPRLISRAA